MMWGIIVLQQTLAIDIQVDIGVVVLSNLGGVVQFCASYQARAIPEDDGGLDEKPYRFSMKRKPLYKERHSK